MRAHHQAVGDELQVHAAPPCGGRRAEIELGDRRIVARVRRRRPHAGSGPRPAHRRGRRSRAPRGILLDQEDGDAGRRGSRRAWRRPSPTSFGDRPAEASSSISSFGLDHQRAGDRQHLPLPAGQPAGRQRRRWRARSGKKSHTSPRSAPAVSRLRQDVGGEPQIVVDRHQR